MKYRTHWTTPVFRWLIGRHRRPYDVSYQGRRVRVFPDVLSPRYDWSGKFGVECLPALQGKSFLEIGCGCGIVSLFAALNGAARVAAVDISPIAVRNTKFNFDRYALKNAIVIQGSLFDPISGRFDVIFFNAPFHGNSARTWLEMAVSDENYQSLRKFISHVEEFLTAGGRVLLGFSPSGDEVLLHTELKRADLEVVKVQEDTRRGYTCKYYTLRCSGLALASGEPSAS
jgi:release factor glutamine methyltransferase